MTKKFFKHILTGLLLGAPLLTLASSPNDIYKVEEKSEIHIDFRVNTDYDVKWLNDTKMNDFENILNKELVNSTLKWSLYRSRLISYFTLTFHDAQTDDLNEIKYFLERISDYDLLEEFNIYSSKKTNSVNYKIPFTEDDFVKEPEPDKKPNDYFYNPYKTNFDSNRFYEADRNEVNISRYGWAKRINVGVFEYGDNDQYLMNPNDSKYFFTDEENDEIDSIVLLENVDYKDKSRFSDHANLVGSIIGGKGGVNLFTRIYSHGFTDDKTEIKSIEKLILDHNCKIINMSYGKNYENLFFLNKFANMKKYNENAKQFDDLARANPEVLFVFAAGNSGSFQNENWKTMVGRKLAWNTIVVGSNDKNGNRSTFSSFGNYDNLKKITVLANGEDYIDPDKDGTSYSAPFISGVLSYTLQKYENKYNLGKNNLIALATLSASTYSNNKTENEYLSKNGAGTFDYSKLKSAFDSLKYYKLTDSLLPYSDKKYQLMNIDQEITLETVDAQKGEFIRGAIAWEAKEFVAWKNRTYLIFPKKTVKERKPYIKNFDLVLKDERNNVIAKSSADNQNIEFIKYKVEKDGKYKWVLKRNSDYGFENYKNEISSSSYYSKSEIAFAHTKGKD